MEIQNPVLCLTHSGRITTGRFCSREHLERRFSRSGRLENLPPLHHLRPQRIHRDGAISFYRLQFDCGRAMRILPLCVVKTKPRAQHVARLDDYRLLVAFEGSVECWRFHSPLGTMNPGAQAEYRVEHSFSHPLLCGIRTIYPLQRERVVLACSGPDAVLIFNWSTGRLERCLRMPADLYGHNYELSPEVDLHRNYIGNDRQTTHLNAAYPDPGGRRILVSTLIQGAIGCFDLETGGYRELARGFTGCHGARLDHRGQIYFADSCSGTLVFLDRDGTVSARFPTPSRWLHDALQLAPDIFALALADSNELRVVHLGTGELLFRQKFLTCPSLLLQPLYRLLPKWIGNSLQFLSLV